MKKDSFTKTGLSNGYPGDEMISRHPSCFTDYLFPVIGVLIVILTNLPFFILGKNCVIDVHEQLDGELVAYILGSKYMFTGTSVFPEFLGGLPAQALTPPSYGTLLFYKLFDPLYAYLINQLFVTILGFIGMYFWSVRLTGKRFISLFSAVLFSLLPFFTVYGISVSGIPLVALAFFNLGDFGKREYKSGRERITVFVLSYLSIAVYCVFSSLILCGYAVCAVYMLAAIIALVTKKKSKIGKEGVIRIWAGFILLCGIFLLFNRNLILQILIPDKGFLSHKSEVVLNSENFIEKFIGLFVKGADAVPSLHFFIFIMAFAAIIGFIASGKVNRYYVAMVIGVLLALLIALFSAFMSSKAVVDRLNEMSGAVKAFQIDRFYWLYPFIWYTVFALIGTILTERFPKYKIGFIVFLVLALPTAGYVLKESQFKENALEFVRKESTALTWDDFFCEEEFKEVGDYIKDEYGLEQSEYRVGCLGIEPSIALYNGFYTIDGYSNNYELSYKHRFRNVIAKELEKNDYNRVYFDNWGNRCYLLSSEYYGIRLMTKYEHAHYDNLELNTSALKDLGCRFILSAGEIAEAEAKGYKLCKTFDSYDYSYFIYLYEVL